MLFILGNMLFPHYNWLATEQLGAVDVDMVTWVIAQNIGVGVFSPLAGMIADRCGNRLAMRFEILLAAMVPLLAVLLATAALAILHAVPAYGMTLEDALANAYASNSELAAARAGQRKLDEGVPQAMALRRPTIQAQGGLGATNGATTASSSPWATRNETPSTTLVSP